VIRAGGERVVPRSREAFNSATQKESVDQFMIKKLAKPLALLLLYPKHENVGKV